MKNSTTLSPQNALSALVRGSGQGKKQKLNGNEGHHFSEVMQRVNDQRPSPPSKQGFAVAKAVIQKHRDEKIEESPIENMKAVATAKQHEEQGQRDLEFGETHDESPPPAPALQPVALAQMTVKVLESHQSFSQPEMAKPQDHMLQPDEVPAAEHGSSKGKPLNVNRRLAETRAESEPTAAPKPDTPVQQPEFSVPQVAVATKLELANAPAPGEQKVTVTLTKVETVLLPAAPPSVMMHDTAKVVSDSAPASAVLPTPLPAQTVVRTIHFQLQPDHLGDVKVGMHLKGEELRLTVEVSTREAHALLQRDTGLLRDALEKAGFDLAEQSVAITLKLDQPQLQQTSASSDGFSFTRGNNSEQTFHAASDGQNQRQHARQPGKDNNYAQTQSRTTEAEMGASGAGIYL